MGSGSIKEKTAKIPLGTSPEDIAKRLEIFKAIDMNDNGYLSLA
jgi:hypothetical protein